MRERKWPSRIYLECGVCGSRSGLVPRFYDESPLSERWCPKCHRRGHLHIFKVDYTAAEMVMVGMLGNGHSKRAETHAGPQDGQLPGVSGT